MNNLDIKNKLPKYFYTREVLAVAKELLGKTIVKSINKDILSAKIVEVEAYDGSTDEAAHTFKGKTPRNEIMFEEGGLLYVYFTYGMHFCANVVTGGRDEGCAVLIRAVEPLTGIERMISNRFGRKFTGKNMPHNLTNGPAKFTQAFGIDRSANGENLLGDNIFILNQKPIPVRNIISSPRIGIKKSVDLPWRFYIKDNSYISRK